MPAPIRVLIIDDSAFVRKSIREMLRQNSGIEVVGMARNGEEALPLIEELNPDVVTCDLTMPKMDGVEFVRRQMSQKRIPIIVVTASPKDGERALQAMEAGALEIVEKPTALATPELLNVREQLVEAIQAAASATVAKLAPAQKKIPAGLKPGKEIHATNVDLLAIGVSTGGPQALRYLLPQFPADFPVPIVIVLHMPIGYTKLFAEKLDEISALEVIEATGNDVLRPGTAILARAGQHLVFRRTGKEPGMVRTEFTMRPLEKPHRPSVDVLFQSAAEVFKDRVLGVVLTGMGNDGKEGSAWIKAMGGTVLTEAEESCVIYGMPRSVVEAGLSDGAFPLNQITDAMIRAL